MKENNPNPYYIEYFEHHHIEMHEVHDISISEAKPFSRTANVLFESSEGSIKRLGNVNTTEFRAYPSEDAPTCAIHDKKLVIPITDDMRLNFYRAEANLSDRQRRNPNVFKAEVLVPGIAFYVMVMADIDESIILGKPDDRKVLYILNRLGRDHVYPNTSVGFPPGYVRYITISDVHGFEWPYVVHKVFARMTPRCEPTIYEYKHCPRLFDHALFYCEEHNHVNCVALEGQVYMANNATSSSVS
jgi:hypothetical protein